MSTPTFDRKMLGKLVGDMSSADYHGLSGTFSSSQLKDLLDDPEYFHKKHIEKSVERVSIPAFDVGTYFHCAVLEPDKLGDDCAVFDGIRRGKVWDEFKETNSGKTIITASEKTQADGLVKATLASPIAMNRIKRGTPEVSTFSEVLVDGSTVYAKGGELELGKYGWVKAKDKISKKAVTIILKVRADLLADEYILDLKSTTGNAKSVSLMRKKISDYNYDLSASLYLDIFSLATGRTLDQFLWTFASKDFYNCKTYMASSDNVLVGRAKWKKAVVSLAEGIDTNWEFEDSLGVLEPNQWEMEYLKERPEDLL